MVVCVGRGIGTGRDVSNRGGGSGHVGGFGKGGRGVGCGESRSFRGGFRGEAGEGILIDIVIGIRVDVGSIYSCYNGGGIGVTYFNCNF